MNCIDYIPKTIDCNAPAPTPEQRKRWEKHCAELLEIAQRKNIKITVHDSYSKKQHRSAQ